MNLEELQTLWKELDEKIQHQELLHQEEIKRILTTRKESTFSSRRNQAYTDYPQRIYFGKVDTHRTYRTDIPHRMRRILFHRLDTESLFRYAERHFSFLVPTDWYRIPVPVLPDAPEHRTGKESGTTTD